MSDAPQYTKLSMIVPVFDERATVGEVIRRLRSVELPENLDREIIVVNDGSTDGTDMVVKALEDSTVRVVAHKENKGKGAALRSGIDEARGDLILLHDADLEYRPEDVPRLLQPILEGRAQAVFGSRSHPAYETRRLTDAVADRALTAATCVLFNTTLTDVETGLRVFDADVLKNTELTSDGFAFDTELTAKMLKAGHRIAELPVTYDARAPKRPGSKSRVGAFRALFRERFTH